VTVVRWVAALGEFLYKFLVGDDLPVALVMLAALALSGLLARGHVDAWWLVPPVAVAMTAVSLRRRAALRR
jgi:hypothetical protein